MSDIETTYLASSAFGVDPSKGRSVWRDFLRYDPREVGDDVLVSVLLAGTTPRNPGDVARELLIGAGGDFVRLTHPEPYVDVRGVGDAARAKMVAAAELYRRAATRASMTSTAAITNAQTAVEHFKALALGEEESLSAVYLNRRHVPIATRVLTKGSPDYTVVDPKQVLRPAVELFASAFILAHNHPSGDNEPSPDDIAVTERRSEAGRILGVDLLDHIIIGMGGLYTSLAERGLMPELPSRYAVTTGR